MTRCLADYLPRQEDRAWAELAVNDTLKENEDVDAFILREPPNGDSWIVTLRMRNGDTRHGQILSDKHSPEGVRQAVLAALAMSPFDVRIQEVQQALADDPGGSWTVRYDPIMPSGEWNSGVRVLVGLVDNRVSFYTIVEDGDAGVRRVQDESREQLAKATLL